MLRLLLMPFRLLLWIIVLPFKIKLFKLKGLSGLFTLAAIGLLIHKGYEKFVEVGGQYFYSEK